MSKLEDRLKEVLRDVYYDGNDDVDLEHGLPSDKYLAQIISAIKEDGWLSPEETVKVQKMVDSMANLASDMARVPTVQYIKPNRAMTKAQNLMTGSEWLERFTKELDRTDISPVILNPSTHDQVTKAARRASNLEEKE